MFRLVRERRSCLCVWGEGWTDRPTLDLRSEPVVEVDRAEVSPARIEIGPGLEGLIPVLFFKLRIFFLLLLLQRYPSTAANS